MFSHEQAMSEDVRGCREQGREQCPLSTVHCPKPFMMDKVGLRAGSPEPGFDALEDHRSHDRRGLPRIWYEEYPAQLRALGALHSCRWPLLVRRWRSVGTVSPLHPPAVRPGQSVPRVAHVQVPHKLMLSLPGPITSLSSLNRSNLARLILDNHTLSNALGPKDSGHCMCCLP